MAGMMSGMNSMAEGLGNKWGAAYDQAQKGDFSGIQGMKTGGFNKFMGQSQAPDMSKPQGQDVMSLMSMLQGGQMSRNRRF